MCRLQQACHNIARSPTYFARRAPQNNRRQAYGHRLTTAAGAPAGDLFRLMTGERRQALFDNTARAIKGARKETAERHIAHCAKADPAYGAGVRKACEVIGAL
ncbi:catalase-related domain-containing protein [Nonomuraea sp. ZG12]|uniref:catalase-related domain-containing protein n=1 Tax=Nonomuraea sp. ZG12 TaxID=3452207 RepID=UPI003F8B1063